MLAEVGSICVAAGVGMVGRVGSTVGDIVGAKVGIGRLVLVGV